MAARPRRRAGRVPGRRASLPRHRLPALCGAALRPGMSDRSDAPAGGRARHHGLRHVHRLRLLCGGVPVPGRTIATSASGTSGPEPPGGAGLPRRAGRGGVQVHLLRGQDRRGGGDSGHRAGARPRSDPRLRRVVHRPGPPLRDFADPESNVSRLAAENAHFRCTRSSGRILRSATLRGPGDHPGTGPGPGGGGRRPPRGSERPMVGDRQTFWDVRAAMNFIMAG